MNKKRNILLIGTVGVFLVVFLYFFSGGEGCGWGARCKSSDARRESDIRQINLAMEMQYDDDGQYLLVLAGDDGRILNENIGTYLDPLPTDPGDSSCLGYQGISNVSDLQKYCIWACMKDGGFFAASHKGTKSLDKAPTSLDCWEGDERSYIKVVSPNGTEKWITGKTYDIIWKSSGTEKVYISYEENPDIGEAVHGGWIAMESISADTGKYSWKIPEDLFASEYKIRIQSFNPIGMGVPVEMEFSDESDDYFIIMKDKTTDWKTYRNEEYGFEFKYKLLDPKTPIEEKISEEGKRWTISGGATPAYSVRLIKNVSSLEDLKSLLENEMIELVSRIRGIEIKDINLTWRNVTVSGHEAIEMSYEEFIGGLTGTAHKTGVIKDSNAFVIHTVYDSGKGYYELLSTFRFIEEDETADWKTYKSEEAYFEMKYPEEWEEKKETPDEDVVIIAKPDKRGLLMVTYDVIMDNEDINDFFDQVEKSLIRFYELTPCTNKKELDFNGDDAIRCDWVKNTDKIRILQDLGFQNIEEFDYSYIDIENSLLNYQESIGFCVFFIVDSSLDLREKEELYLVLEKILSTFKFSD